MERKEVEEYKKDFSKLIKNMVDRKAPEEEVESIKKIKKEIEKKIDKNIKKEKVR